MKIPATATKWTNVKWKGMKEKSALPIGKLREDGSIENIL
jgi:hypothetical protein